MGLGFLIQTRLGPEFTGFAVAHFVKHAIDGFARGCVPMQLVWKLPPLYHSGVRYQREPTHGQGLEDFALPIQTFQQRWGDCDDLVIYRLWELHVRGIQAECRAVWVGPSVHVLVRLPDGRTEDPSILLGA